MRHKMKINYAVYSRQNGWNDWAEIYCRHSWVTGGGYWLKKSKYLKKDVFSSKFPFKLIFFSTGNTGPIS